MWSIENVDQAEDGEDEEMDKGKIKTRDGVGIKLKELATATGHLSAVTALAWPHRSSHFLVSVSEDSTMKACKPILIILMATDMEYKVGFQDGYLGHYRRN